jgi:hypothetical protein
MSACYLHAGGSSRPTFPETERTPDARRVFGVSPFVSSAASALTGRGEEPYFVKPFGRRANNGPRP